VADETSLDRLEREWAERFALEPKLPSAALLSGAVAMALGFGFVMFLAFAWLHRFPRSYLWGTLIFGTGALAAGLLNRYLAGRWFRQVREWHAQREALRARIEALRACGEAGRDLSGAGGGEV
jgi:hypothetical protein